MLRNRQLNIPQPLPNIKTYTVTENKINVTQNQINMKIRPFVITIMFIFLLHFLTIAQGVRVEPNTKITIESGTTMDITTGNLVLESDATGDVSLIVLGAVDINNSGKTNAYRYLPGNSVQAWHMVGASVIGMAITGSDFAPSNDDDFYAWDEPSPGTWVNFKTSTGQSPTFLDVNNNSDNFQIAKGYLVAYNAINPAKEFTGNLNTGDKTFQLKNSAKKDWEYANGCNLISNPYSSAIDWNLAPNRTTLFKDNFAYTYNEARIGGPGYVEIDGGSSGANIAANQGFFVITKPETANNTNFTFTADMQTHGVSTYYKSNTNNDDKLILRLTGNGYYDETKIRLKEESTYNRDRTDAIKMNSYNVNVPNLYTISVDNINLAVNSIPEIGVENSIPLGIVIPKLGEYTISIIEVSDYISSNTIYLHDELLNKWHKLSQSDYVFSTDAGDVANRFVIHFGVTGINDSNKADMLNIWVFNNQLNIICQIGEAQLEIFDMQGRLISSKTININGKYNEILNLKAGAYIVRIQNSNMVKSKKTILK